MIYKILLSTLLIGLFFCGCVAKTTQNALDKLYPQWINENVNSMIATYGTPANVQHQFADGTSVYTWIFDTGTISAPQSITGNINSYGSARGSGTINSYGNTAYYNGQTYGSSTQDVNLQVNPAYSINTFCEMQITTNSEGKISNMRLRENHDENVCMQACLRRAGVSSIRTSSDHGVNIGCAMRCSGSRCYKLLVGDEQ
jgi:hypothetical protein